MYDAASTILSQKLSQVQGVGQVFVGGGSLPAVRVELDPGPLNKYGIGLDDTAAILQTTSVSQPKGQFANGSEALEIQCNDQLHKAEEYRPIIVSYQNGAPVRLSDLGTVEDSVEDLRAAGSVNGKPAIMLVLFRSPGANIIATVDRVREMLPQLATTIPQSIDLSVVLDRSPPIRGSLRDVEHTLVISGILVILVVFAFLRNLRSTLIPGIAVPVSLISTFGVMYLLGYSLDNLSLMALTVATGFVVDDAIVVLENITRYMEKGQSPLQAALRGAREIAFTVLSMSISLVAVFTPILLMGGMVGRLFREFAVTLSVAILISLVVSLTTTPMMCATILKKETTRAHNFLYRATEWIFDQMRSIYDKSLRWALRHSLTMLFITVFTLGTNVLLFWFIPKGFFPDQDTGRISGRIQAAQDISFQAMSQKLTEVVNIIKTDPDVADVMGFTGGAGPGGHHKLRSNVHYAQAFSRAESNSDGYYGAAAQKARPGGGRPYVSATGTGTADRRNDQQCRISIHPAGRKPGGPQCMGAPRTGRGSYIAPVGGCQQRSAEQGAASHGADRPPHRVASRHLRAAH